MIWGLIHHIQEGQRLLFHGAAVVVLSPESGVSDSSSLTVSSVAFGRAPCPEGSFIYDVP
jgi:hypothetical protein